MYDQIFIWGGGGAGLVDGQSGNSERCLKWGGGSSSRMGTSVIIWAFVDASFYKPYTAKIGVWIG